MSDSLVTPMDCSLPCDFLDKNTGAGCHFLLQEIFPTQGSNPHLLLGRQILYHSAAKGSQAKAEQQCDITIAAAN